MKKPHISIFRDRDKEAKFWETHYKETWKTGKPIKVKFAKNLSETINIRLDDSTLNAVRERAHQKGIGPTQLIRMWIKERLNSPLATQDL